jgi:hypothetical protein
VAFVALKVIGMSVVVAALVVFTAWLFKWPFEKAAYLAPIIVVAAAAVVGLFALWTRVALESLRKARRPRLVLALWAAAIGLIVLLTVLGVELPREG